MSKNQKAFTLIELLVTISVVGVLLALAVPSYNKQVLNNRSVALGEEFLGAVNLARYEAVKRAKRVSICASSDSTTATPSCTGNWTDGYIMFVDEATSDDAASPALGSTPTIIRVYGKSVANSSIAVTNNATATTFIRYTALGSLARISNSTASTIITTQLNGCVGDRKRVMSINLSGLVSIKKDRC